MELVAGMEVEEAARAVLINGFTHAHHCVPVEGKLCARQADRQTEPQPQQSSVVAAADERTVRGQAWKGPAAAAAAAVERAATVVAVVVSTLPSK